MTVEDFYVRCNDGVYNDDLCCPYIDCHWDHEIGFDFSLGDMIEEAKDHLKEKHP